MYMLRCADDSLYTGVTIDPERRLQEHNNDNDKGARYTRARRPVELIYQETCESRSAASKREHQLKQLSRAQKLSFLRSKVSKAIAAHNKPT